MIIRDPIHGDISLGPRETAVLDLPDVQRLRGIRQLGTAHLVYPGALHTRFDHSLGTAAMARRLVATLRERGVAIDEDLASRIAVAALLHDVTHVPFGHTLEDERRLFPRHDRGQRWERMLAGRLGEGLQRLGLRDDLVALWSHREDGPFPPWARDLVSGMIDADLLDYLLRDAWFTGIAQRYDERIFRYFTLADDRLVLQFRRHGMDRPDAASETVQVLRLRYFLTERVYYHHTKVAAGAMVSKAVEIAHEHSRLGEDELLTLGDAVLLDRFRGIPRPESPDPRLLRLADRLETRNLLKRAYVVSGRTVPRHARQEWVTSYHEDPATRASAEATIAREIGCDAAEVILYCPALTVMKETSALVESQTGLAPLNQVDRSGEILALEARYEQLWRFFVFVPEEHVPAAAAVAQRLFQRPSEHQASPIA